MKLKPWFAASAGLLGMLACGPAFAQAIPPGEEGELARILEPEPGARICYRRIYDAAHLKAHPRQTVTEMEFRLAYHRFEPDDAFPKGQRNYYFELRAKRRDETRALSAMGECGTREDGRTIFCGVECDGGGVGVKVADKPDSILVNLKAAGRLRMTAGCDEDEEAVELLPGADDKVFLLNRVAEAECPAYDDW